ncbi:hypothetical protein [Demequina sp.]|uniref:hypothetical protein n=1 Tax=Demequina sp. TaxID=2050685 RepID=UPI0025B89B32|nr:hypothetical protein [Demequina sp.]
MSLLAPKWASAGVWPPPAQNALLLAIALPAWTMVENPSPLGAYDAVAATLFLGSTAFTE